MDIPPRQRYRLADLIRQQLLELQTVRYRGILAKVHGFLEAVAELRAANGRLACCVIRNWNVAAAEVTEQVSALLVNVPYHCGDVQRAIEGPKVQIPSVREVLAELDQLDEEFDPVRYDPKLKVLTVTTEDIELEDVHLGPFEIQLQVAALRDLRHHGDVYRIVALEPNCACSNEDVTHPHVSGERLCEGDAGAAIGMALSNGRIADFFHLVNAVLTTYNPSSPFVALDQWYGHPCHDCGHTMGADEGRWCEACEHDLCDDCSSYCIRCDQTRCLGCLETCPVCEERVCSSCMTTCPDCHRNLCKTCLDEEQCVCIQQRQENQENEDNEPQPQQVPVVPQPAAAEPAGQDEPVQAPAATQAPARRRRRTRRRTTRQPSTGRRPTRRRRLARVA